MRNAERQGLWHRCPARRGASGADLGHPHPCTPCWGKCCSGIVGHMMSMHASMQPRMAVQQQQHAINVSSCLWCDGR